MVAMMRDSRVVLPDDVVDAIIDEQDAGGDGTQAVEEPLASEINQAIPAPATPAEPPNTASSATGTGSTAALTNTDTLAFDSQALLDVSAQRYACSLRPCNHAKMRQISSPIISLGIAFRFIKPVATMPTGTWCYWVIMPVSPMRVVQN